MKRIFTAVLMLAALGFQTLQAQDIKTSQDTKLPNGWIHRTVTQTDGAVIKLYIKSDYRNSYAVDMHADGKVRSVRISTATKPGESDGLFVNFRTTPSVIVHDARVKPPIYLYDDLLNTYEGLPSAVWKFLYQSRDAVYKAAETPSELKPVKNS